MVRSSTSKLHGRQVRCAHLRASCHVSRAGKVDTTRQEEFTDCLAGLGERRRRISSFTDIGEQSHWWTLAYLEGNHYVHFSYSFSPHPPGPHGRTIAPLSTVAPPANITGPTHMAGGPNSKYGRCTYRRSTRSSTMPDQFLLVSKA